ncbi:MAG: formylglycine-generating enzyme family protein [Pirellulales bacterium]|nr:formylglycine-generating enzyme family protein [Pirellulales bacterium]
MSCLDCRSRGLLLPSVRLALVLASGGFTSGFVGAKETPLPSGPGIVDARPAEGPYVEVDGKFMAPYFETIPGTDVTFEMIPIPGGEFLLGSPEDEADRSEDEGPQVRVRIAPMWVGRHEVTWAEYQSYMAMYERFKQFEQLAAASPEHAIIGEHVVPVDADGVAVVDAVTCPTPLYDPSFTYSAGESPEQPAVSMTPFAARQYSKWLSGLTGRDYRLPTEAEWEYAARAGTTTAYSFGDEADGLEDYAWFDDNADYETHPVGGKQPNAWGLHDMLGNVAEWTLDEYAPDQYEQLRGVGAEPVDGARAVRWPTKSYPRAVRGGSWLDTADRLRVAARQASEDDEWKLSDPNAPHSPWWYTEEPATGIGMRVVRPWGGVPAEDRPRVWDAETESIARQVQRRLQEGRGVRGVVDRQLPAAIDAAEKLAQ